VTAERLAAIMIELQAQGCHNIKRKSGYCWISGKKG
jgi:hypothetical protein